MRWDRASTTDRTIRRTCGGRHLVRGERDPMRRWILRAVWGTGMSLVALRGAAAQATGQVIGQVVAAESKSPIQGVQVTVTGTAIRAGTNVEGRYVLRNVPL